jgi:GntR family transcriptional regulator / MocR family aminotransferase
MFILDSKDSRPLYVKLYHQIKNQILSGNLLPHTKLPSVRHLAAELAVSRNTVEDAYEQLCAEGFIYSKPQSGYYISLLDQEFNTRPCPNPATPIESGFSTGGNYSYDFHPAGLAPDSFPSKVWRKLLTNCLQEDPEQFALYGNPQGEKELRRQIQLYLERFRGVSCDPEQIVVGCGLQDSLAIIASLLRGAHSALAVEEPGHWIPRSVFQNYAFSFSPVPVNSDGINLDYLKNTDSTVVYVTPSHQFPLGYVMSVENRLKLINWAETVGGVIIEDDYDSELRYHGKPIPALQGLYPKGSIIYVGSFSKVLSPALRVGYMVLPYQFLNTYNQLFSKYSPTVSLLEQRTLSQFMKQGYWERHLRKMRIVYKRKHDALIQSIERHFGARVNILGQGAGLHVVLELLENIIDEEELIHRAQRKNVRVFPITDTYQFNNHHFSRVMLGFGRMDPDELEKGIELLSQAWS